MINVFIQNTTLIMSKSTNSIKYSTIISLLIIKKFDFYYIDCEFEILFDKNYTANIENNYHYKTDNINIKSYLIFYIDSCEINGYKFKNINHMIIKTISCMCNMSYKYYINQPMSMLERRINMIIDKNPQSINALDRTKNHPLIRKYSSI